MLLRRQLAGHRCSTCQMIHLQILVQRCLFSNTVCVIKLIDNSLFCSLSLVLDLSPACGRPMLQGSPEEADPE